MNELNEKFGKDTLKALGTVTGLSKTDYTGQNIPRAKRFKDNLIDFAQTVGASSAVMGSVGPKSAIIPTSILAGKVIGARRAVKQHEKLMARKNQEKEQMSKPETVIAEAVDCILNKNFDDANSLLESAVKDILEKKMFEMKKMTAARLSEQIVHPDGHVHMATGEKVLPSVARQRRWLAEATAEVKVGRTRLAAEPSTEERMGALHDERENLGAKYDELRDKEWDIGIKKGQKTAIQYKKDRTKLMDSLYADAAKRYGNDHESIARDVHAKILQNHSNEGIGAFYGHAHKFEDLHPTVRDDLLIGARQAISPAHAAHREEMKRRQTEFDARMAASREQDNAAMSKFLERQKQARMAAKPNPTTQQRPSAAEWAEKLGENPLFESKRR